MISKPSAAQVLKTDGFEFFPQVSLATFTADLKIGGTMVGGELIYHYVPKQETAWCKILNTEAIDLIFNYKEMNGVTFLADPLKTPYGSSYSILTGISIPLIQVKNTMFTISPAFGLGYLTETYFTSKNPSIGSHLNFASRIGLKLEQGISASTKITAGIDAQHFSNGGFRISNKGINSVNLGLGISTALNFTKKNVDTTVRPISFRKHSVDFGVAWGQRGVFHRKESLERGALYLGYNYRLRSFIGFGAGLDAVYHPTVYNPFDHARTHEGLGTSYDHWKAGIAVGPDLWAGKLALTAKYGYYLHFNSFYPVKTYWTGGLKYQFFNRFAIQAKMFVHKTEADFTAFGLLFTL